MRTTVPYCSAPGHRPVRAGVDSARHPVHYPASYPTNVQHGWTLVELLASCAIVLILATFAIPGLQHWIDRTSQAAAFNLLQHAASFARAQAINEHRYFTVCGSDDGIQCNRHWRDHIVIFSDDNRNEAIDRGERLYRTFNLGDHTPCIQWRASGGRHYLQFKPNGAVNGTAGHFRLCQNSRGQTQQKLVVSLNGRTSLRQI